MTLDVCLATICERRDLVEYVPNLCRVKTGETHIGSHKSWSETLESLVIV